MSALAIGGWIVYVVVLVAMLSLPWLIYERRERRRRAWLTWRIPRLDLRESWRAEIRERGRWSLRISDTRASAKAVDHRPSQ